ncbi:hypothetical protein DPMN_165999 [Dreissena polymorpha]|uniref:Uncharacterized protein n=1 Tax=Dreissena polymorpha TaxID=45954 RepID=A0A9D4EXW8_DREPO|nr:hypothetical protein DPMN_165999 [Dreissena polymorpha]
MMTGVCIVSLLSVESVSHRRAEGQCEVCIQRGAGPCGGVCSEGHGAARGASCHTPADHWPKVGLQ